MIASCTIAIRALSARAGIGAAILLCAVCVHAQTKTSDPPPAAQPGDPLPAVKATKPAPATPLDTKKIEFGWNKIWQPQWDMIVEDALPPSLLSNQVPRDVRRFCPRDTGAKEIAATGEEGTGQREARHEEPRRHIA